MAFQFDFERLTPEAGLALIEGMMTLTSKTEAEKAKIREFLNLPPPPAIENQRSQCSQHSRGNDA